MEKKTLTTQFALCMIFRVRRTVPKKNVFICFIQNVFLKHAANYFEVNSFLYLIIPDFIGIYLIFSGLKKVVYTCGICLNNLIYT